MSRLTILKVVLLLTGVLVFGYGMRVDDAIVRWWGIGFMAAGLLLRLLGARRRRVDEDGGA